MALLTHNWTDVNVLCFATVWVQLQPAQGLALALTVSVDASADEYFSLSEVHTTLVHAYAHLGPPHVHVVGS
jgi:hypothetical protein